MQTFRKILVAMLIALAVMAPLGIAASMTNPVTQHSAVRIANGPTPTPTPGNGQGGCIGGGC